MALSRDDAFQAARHFLEAAVGELNDAEQMAKNGNPSGALMQINMGISSRLSHANTELEGVIELLEAEGGVYPPP